MTRLLVVALSLFVAGSMLADRRRATRSPGGWTVPQCTTVTGFPAVALTFDSQLVGPDEATAAASFQKVPVGMYLNSIAFFLVYHTAAVACMRRVRSTTRRFAPFARRLAWVAIVVSAAWFFAWAETRLYITESATACR